MMKTGLSFHRNGICWSGPEHGRVCPSKRSTRLVPLLRLLVALLGLLAFGLPPPAAAAPPGALPQTGTVVAVFDGDTVRLASGDQVRLLGIDSPELDHESGRHQCYALEARDQAQGLLLQQQVRLEYDGEHRDRHGRLLAYLHLADGRCVNQELIRLGCAWLYRYRRDFSRRPAFLEAQRDALQSRRGLWGRCPVKEESRYLGNRESYVFHRPDCAYGRQTGAARRIEFTSRRQALEAGYHPCRRCLP